MVVAVVVAVIAVAVVVVAVIAVIAVVVVGAGGGGGAGGVVAVVAAGVVAKNESNRRGDQFNDRTRDKYPGTKKQRPLRPPTVGPRGGGHGTTFNAAGEWHQKKGKRTKKRGKHVLALFV